MLGFQDIQISSEYEYVPCYQGGPENALSDDHEGLVTYETANLTRTKRINRRSSRETTLTDFQGTQMAAGSGNITGNLCMESNLDSHQELATYSTVNLTRANRRSKQENLLDFQGVQITVGSENNDECDGNTCSNVSGRVSDFVNNFFFSEDIVEFPLVRSTVEHTPKMIRGDSDENLMADFFDENPYQFSGNINVTAKSLGMNTFNFKRIGSAFHKRLPVSLTDCPNRQSIFAAIDDLKKTFAPLKRRYRILRKYYMIEGDHGIGIFLCYREHAMDLRTHCCSGRIVLGMSSAHLRDDVYAILCTYQHMSVRVLNCTKITLDVMGPIGLYSTPLSLQHYLHYFTDLKKLLKEADTSNLVFGTDGNETMREALSQVFPQCKQLVCNFTLNLTFRKTLKDSTALSEEDRKNFSVAYMGIARFLDKDASENYVQQLTECCRASCPDFQDLFTNMYLPLIFSNQGGYHSWINVSSEEDISDVKKLIQLNRDIEDVLDILTIRVGSSFVFIKEAISDRTKCTLTLPYKRFQVSKAKWKHVMTEQDREHLFYKLMTHCF